MSKPVAHINSRTCGGAGSYTATYRWFEGSLMVQAAESNGHIHFMSQA